MWSQSSAGKSAQLGDSSAVGLAPQPDDSVDLVPWSPDSSAVEKGLAPQPDDSVDLSPAICSILDFKCVLK